MILNIEKLPLWAQKLIEELRETIGDLERENSTLRRVNEVVQSKQWYNTTNYGDKVMELWELNDANPKVFATLYPGDTLLVGRVGG